MGPEGRVNFERTRAIGLNPQLCGLLRGARSMGCYSSKLQLNELKVRAISNSTESHDLLAAFCAEPSGALASRVPFQSITVAIKALQITSIVLVGLEAKVVFHCTCTSIWGRTMACCSASHAPGQLGLQSSSGCTGPTRHAARATAEYSLPGCPEPVVSRHPLHCSPAHCCLSCCALQACSHRVSSRDKVIAWLDEAEASGGVMVTWQHTSADTLQSVSAPTSPFDCDPVGSCGLQQTQKAQAQFARHDSSAHEPPRHCSKHSGHKSTVSLVVMTGDQRPSGQLDGGSRIDQAVQHVMNTSAYRSTPWRHKWTPGHKRARLTPKQPTCGSARLSALARLPACLWPAIAQPSSLRQHCSHAARGAPAWYRCPASQQHTICTRLAGRHSDCHATRRRPQPRGPLAMQVYHCRPCCSL